MFFEPNMRFTRRYLDLQTMCLHVIAHNIETFMNNNQIPKIYIEFLHRAYADKLYRLVAQKSNISEGERVLWFLSPYKTQIELQTMHLRTETLINRMKVMGPVIVSLNLTDFFSSDKLLKALICCVPNVKRLILKGTNCSDSVLLCLRSVCPSIVTLDLSDCRDISNTGMEHLCSNHLYIKNLALKNLDVTETRVSQLGISLILKSMPDLLILRHHNLSVILFRLYYCDLIPNGHKTIRYNLTEFIHYKSCSSNLNSILKVWTALCPNINSVIINDSVSNFDVQVLKRFALLKEVRFMPYRSDGPLTSEVTSGLFEKGEMLTTLTFINAHVSVETLVRCCRNLKSMCFHNITFEHFIECDKNDKQRPLDNLSTVILKHLDCSLSSTFKSVNLLISLSHNLKELHIKYTKGFTEELTNVILNSTYKLCVVDFSFTDIKLPSLLPFFRYETVKKINIDSCIYIPGESHEFKQFMAVESDNTFSWRRCIDDYEMCDNDDVEKLINIPDIFSIFNLETLKYL